MRCLIIKVLKLHISFSILNACNVCDGVRTLGYIRKQICLPLRKEERLIGRRLTMLTLLYPQWSAFSFAGGDKGLICFNFLINKTKGERNMWKKSNLLVIIMMVLLLLAVGCANNSTETPEAENPEKELMAPANPDVILATTTSTQDSGLLDVIIPVDRKSTRLNSSHH